MEQKTQQINHERRRGQTVKGAKPAKQISKRRLRSVAGIAAMKK
jgi:hypothetical protein